MQRSGGERTPLSALSIFPSAFSVKERETNRESKKKTKITDSMKSETGQTIHILSRL